MDEALENPELAANGSVTGSDAAGTAGPSTALLLAQNRLLKEKRPAYLNYVINDSDRELVITLDCGRQTAKFKNKTLHVRCSDISIAQCVRVGNISAAHSAI
jgi:hypothetical protein